MLAELYLRVAADPNAVGSLTATELGELFAEPVPPLWVFTEAARRRHDATVMAQLFSHPEAPRNLLWQTVGSDAKRLERFNFHVAVYLEPPPTLASILSRIVPEWEKANLSPAQEMLLAVQLAPICWQALYPSLRTAEAKATLDKCLGLPTKGFYHPKLKAATLPRHIDPFSQFLLLGDFFYYLTCPPYETVCDLPVLARVALALNEQQPLAGHLGDADVRVRAAAEERKSWSES